MIFEGSVYKIISVIILIWVGNVVGLRSEKRVMVMRWVLIFEFMYIFYMFFLMVIMCEKIILKLYIMYVGKGFWCFVVGVVGLWRFFEFWIKGFCLW